MLLGPHTQLYSRYINTHTGVVTVSSIIIYALPSNESAVWFACLLLLPVPTVLLYDNAGTVY